MLRADSFQLATDCYCGSHGGGLDGKLEKDMLFSSLDLCHSCTGGDGGRHVCPRHGFIGGNGSDSQHHGDCMGSRPEGISTVTGVLGPVFLQQEQERRLLTPCKVPVHDFTRTNKSGGPAALMEQASLAWADTLSSSSL